MLAIAALFVGGFVVGAILLTLMHGLDNQA